MKAVRNNQDMRFPNRSLALVLVSSGLFVAYVLVKPGNQHLITLIDNLLQGFLEGVGFLLTLPLWLPERKRMGPSARSPLPDSMQRWVPFLLGLGILSHVIGQATWTYNEDIIHLPMLFPSWADAGYLGSFPFVLLAILFLPSRSLLGHTRARVLLDGLLILVGAVTFSWYFVLGPTILRGSTTLWGQIIGPAYPLGNLVLIFCLLRLGINKHDRGLQPVVVFLSLALAIIIITDSIYGYQVLHNGYMTGGLLDVGWPLGYMLVGLSARAMRLHLASDTTFPPSVSIPDAPSKQGREQHSSLWQSSIPLFFVPAVLALLIWTEYGGDQPALKPGVILGVATLLGSMIVRQVVVMHEAISQNTLLYTMQQDLQARNEALLRAQEQMKEQARIEEAYKQERRLNELKDQFILNVSHELRTPLTQVYGYLELLGTYHGELTSEKQEAYLRRAMQGSEALLHLITTVLDAAEREGPTLRLQKQHVLVEEVIRELLEQVEPESRQAHPVELKAAGGFAVQADPQALRQVLRNLLSNAFKYAPPHTPIQIGATQGDLPAGHPEAPAQICIYVQDSGPGIPVEDMPLLFGKFVRLKRDLAGPVRGTGLGLYISKQLVEAMNGRIWVESEGIAGKGSRFCLTLPAWSQNASEEQRA